MIHKSLIFNESEIYKDDMCLELDKVNISYLNSDHLQEAIQMIICKRPVHPDDHCCWKINWDADRLTN